MTTQIRIRCTEPFHAEVLLDEAPGKLLLNVLGRSYEGYLARGEGAQVIRALTKLAKEDNTGSITLVPKLANYLLRIVTERIGHFAYRMNQVNDKVENQRWGKNGLKLTDDMLEASQGHDEVYRLSQVLTVLSLASRHYANVYFIREDLEDKEDDELEEDDLDSDDSDDDLEDDDSEHDETPEETSERISENMPTTQRRTLTEARAMAIEVVVRMGAKADAAHEVQFVTMHEVLRDDEAEQWSNDADVKLLYSAVVNYLADLKANNRYTLVRELEQHEATSLKHPKGTAMFAVGRLLPSGVSNAELEEVANKVLRRAIGEEVDGFPAIRKPEGMAEWLVPIVTFMTQSEIEKFGRVQDEFETRMTGIFTARREDREREGIYDVRVARDSEEPFDAGGLYLVVTDRTVS